MTLPIKPVLDRTEADALYAEMHRSDAQYCKGALNIEVDLNRIELNTAYLADQINEYGYYVRVATKTNWAMTDFPTLSEVNRIRRNVSKLIEAYARMPGRPDIRFVATLDWNDANSLEQNLQHIDTLLQWMINGFRYCGGFNFNCGGGVILP